MRWPVFVVLLFLGCPATPPPTAGSSCGAENIGRCDAVAPRLLQCINGVFVIYADCKGPRGCSVSSATADCDTSGNSAGERCAPTSEGKVRCDPDGGLNILRCDDGGLEVIFECSPPSVCALGDAGLSCY